MLCNFVYENHQGKRFEGLKNGVYMNTSDLRDYEWGYTAINNRIAHFHLPVTKRSIPLVIICGSDEKAVAVKNELLNLTESDIVAKRPGKVYVGDCYISGYITASQKNDYLLTQRYCKVTLTLTCGDPTWYKERRYYANESRSKTMGSGFDYPHDYLSDYAVGLPKPGIVCDSVRDNAFRLRIFGPVVDPAVYIGDHEYSIKGSVGSGENVLIDSVAKTITLTTVTGKTVNWFDKRNRDSYIFEPIPTGINSLTCQGHFLFELTVIEKRSEPEWT